MTKLRTFLLVLAAGLWPPFASAALGGHWPDFSTAHWGVFLAGFVAISVLFIVLEDKFKSRGHKSDG